MINIAGKPIGTGCTNCSGTPGCKYDFYLGFVFPLLVFCVYVVLFVMFVHVFDMGSLPAL